jgi:hypothetical protein
MTTDDAMGAVETFSAQAEALRVRLAALIENTGDAADGEAVDSAARSLLYDVWQAVGRGHSAAPEQALAALSQVRRLLRMAARTHPESRAARTVESVVWACEIGAKALVPVLRELDLGTPQAASRRRVLVALRAQQASGFATRAEVHAGLDGSIGPTRVGQILDELYAGDFVTRVPVPGRGYQYHLSATGSALCDRWLGPVAPIAATAPLLRTWIPYSVKAVAAPKSASAGSTASAALPKTQARAWADAKAKGKALNHLLGGIGSGLAMAS